MIFIIYWIIQRETVYHNVFKVILQCIIMQSIAYIFSCCISFILKLVIRQCEKGQQRTSNRCCDSHFMYVVEVLLHINLPFIFKFTAINSFLQRHLQHSSQLLPATGVQMYFVSIVLPIEGRLYLITFDEVGAVVNKNEIWFISSKSFQSVIE